MKSVLWIIVFLSPLIMALLKALHVITWSWWWVFSPWLVILVFIVVLLIYMGFFMKTIN